MSAVGMSILLSADVASQQENKPLQINMKEGPLPIVDYYSVDIDGETIKFPCVELRHKPILYPERKVFIFIYERQAIQQKIYGKLMEIQDPLGQIHYRLALALDKNFTIPAENDRNYVVDYYYEYEDEALIYTVQKERFNGLFTLEAKFYSKDENEGKNYTNILYMPKVRVVSNINLQLGERANPTVSTFNIIGLPETVGDQKNLIMDITRLGRNIDADI